MAEKKWKFRWREDGQHRQKSFYSRLERDTYAHRVRLRLEAPASHVTFGEFAETWLERHCQQAETTRLVTRVNLDGHLIPAIGELKLSEIRKSDLLELRAELRRKTGRMEKPLNPKTVNNLMGLARQILQAAVELDLLAVNPATGIRALAKEKRAFDYWTAEERDKFLAAIRPRDPAFADLVLVAAHTGLRRGEIWALTRGQLDFDRKLIRVDAVYCPKLKRRLPRSKNGEVGYVPMNRAVADVLEPKRKFPLEAPVFDPELFRDVYDRFQRRAKEAGVRVIRWHDLRHTTASCLVIAGVPLYTVQRIMRHKSIAMTERYAHLSPDHLADAMERLVRGSVREESSEDAKVLNLFTEPWRLRQGSKVKAA